MHQAALQHRRYSCNGVGQSSKINATLRRRIWVNIAHAGTLCVNTVLLLTNRSGQSAAAGHRLRHTQDALSRGEIPDIAEHIGVVSSRSTGGSQGRDGLIGYRTV